MVKPLGNSVRYLKPARGNKGDSAYQIALDYTDFVGTPKQWIESLRGPAGQPGFITLEQMYNILYKTHFTEIIRSGETIVKIVIWDDALKQEKLFTKEIFYIGELISQVLITNEITPETLTIDIAYNNDGDVISTLKTLVQS